MHADSIGNVGRNELISPTGIPFDQFAARLQLD
jgi:hypothetical protein